MPRTIKTAAERKSELVDCAEALFFAKGYEATTVADILARSGLSKGAFYHHFESKEDLLDALTERFVDAVIATAGDILDDTKLDALTRLNRFLAHGGAWKREAAPVLSVVYVSVFKPENAVLYQRMIRAVVSALTPVLTGIVEQGVREGTFNVPDPAIVAEMLIHLANARQALVAEAVGVAELGDVESAAALIEPRLLVEQKIIDRILGLPEGSVVLFEPAFLRAMLAALAEAQNKATAKSAA